MYLTARERGIKLQTIIQHTLLAHKTGTIDHLANDVGIVYTARGNYALAMSYNGNLCSEEEYMSTRGPAVGDPILAQLSRETYDAFTADGSPHSP